MSSTGAKGWLFQRVSGSLLFVTLAAHFYIYHYFRGPGMWGFESIGYGANDLLTLADPANAKYFALANLFSNPVWKAFDVSFITLACYHGFYGIRSIVDDWVVKDSARTIGNWVVTLLGFLLWIIGVVSVISFNPQSF